MRRGMWLGVGAALGAGGTLWARRRLEAVSERVRTGEITGDVVRIVDHRTKMAARRVRRAVDAGRESARRREEQLWRDMETAARDR